MRPGKPKLVRGHHYVYETSKQSCHHNDRHTRSASCTHPPCDNWLVCATSWKGWSDSPAIPGIIIVQAILCSNRRGGQSLFRDSEESKRSFC